MTEKILNNQNAIAKIEALLFYHGEPIAIKKIAPVLEISEEAVREGVSVLKEKYQKDEASGLTLIFKGNEIQITTKPECASIFEDLVKDDLKEELTPAALETLSLVAYLGPLTRPEIDYIRGVNSSFILRNLLMRGIISREEEKGKGGLFRYSAGLDFLKHIGLDDVSKLPDYEKYRKVLKSVRSAKETNSAA